MFEAIVILIILILLVSIVVSMYYIYDYYTKYAKKVDSKFNKMDVRMDGEQRTRMRTMNQVVNQINEVNNDISKEVTNANLSITQNSNNISNVSKGINSVFSFTSNINNVDSNLTLSDLPGSANTNMSLLSHVTALGGFNINDLYYTGANDKKQFNVSGKNNTSYITMPDANGAISVKAPLAFNKGSISGASISAVGANQGYIKTKSLGLGAGVAPTGTGSADPVNPNASMHIMTTTGEATDVKVPFKISVDSTDVLKIRKSGVMVARGIYLSPNMSETAPKTKIEVTDSGELVITPPSSSSEQNGKGNLYINGNIKASGTINTVGGNITQAAVTVGGPMTYTGNEGFSSGPIVMEGDEKRTATPVDYMNSRYLLPKPPACM